MPEHVHRRLDSASPRLEITNTRDALSLTDATSLKDKKRKRDNVDETHPRKYAKTKESTRKSLPVPHSHGQQTNPSDGLQSVVWSDSKSNSRSKNMIKLTNESQSLKDRAKSLESSRKTLPIWSHATEIRDALRGKDVMILVGETGSGKSTQVPQMLVNEPWCKPQWATIPRDALNSGHRLGSDTVSIDRSPQTVRVGGCIAITEPRRVAATTLARRVAEESGSPLGSLSPKSTVGYSVRFDQSTSPNTRIKFLTEGTLMQELLRDPWLKAYSAVCVDEVHERGANVDLLLGFLRNILAGKNEGRGGIPLKVIVMSATAETDILRAFFEEGFVQEEGNGAHGHAEDQGDGTDRPEYRDDSESEWSGISSDGERDAVSIHGDGATKSSHSEVKEPQSKTANRIATCYIEGRQYQVTLKYTAEPVQDIVEASLRLVFQIHRQEPMPGDVLVFFHGRDIIESLESLVKTYAQDMGPELPKLLVLPLFAALSQAAQQRVFQPAPRNTRKIIIATNIAETSVTVPGVRFVIDTGKAKIKQFRTSIGMESLLIKPISQSSAIQRQGRAGREGPGQCYRLYTESDYLTMQQSNTPEILRCDLSHAILTMKASGINDIHKFSFLDRPQENALEKALLQLWLLGALTESGGISETGLQIAKLPINVCLGRALIAAAEPELNCVSEVIDIVSSLSVEDLFLNLTSEEKKEKAESARRELYKREGDHLTLLIAVQAYAAENTDRKDWAARHFVSHRAMKAAMEVRKQLRAHCMQSKLLNLPPNQEVSAITPELTASILKSFMKGFATKTARLCADGSYKTMVGNQVVAIHPSSGLFGKKVEAIMFNEFVYTSRSYAKSVSAVQLDWIAGAFEEATKGLE